MTRPETIERIAREKYWGTDYWDRLRSEDQQTERDIIEFILDALVPGDIVSGGKCKVLPIEPTEESSPHDQP